MCLTTLCNSGCWSHIYVNYFCHDSQPELSTLRKNRLHWRCCPLALGVESEWKMFDSPDFSIKVTAERKWDSQSWSFHGMKKKLMIIIITYLVEESLRNLENIGWRVVSWCFVLPPRDQFDIMNSNHEFWDSLSNLRSFSSISTPQRSRAWQSPHFPRRLQYLGNLIKMDLLSYLMAKRLVGMITRSMVTLESRGASIPKVKPPCADCHSTGDWPLIESSSQVFWLEKLATYHPSQSNDNDSWEMIQSSTNHIALCKFWFYKETHRPLGPASSV